jgi:hypothetical protein
MKVNTVLVTVRVPESLTVGRIHEIVERILRKYGFTESEKAA